MRCSCPSHSSAAAPLGRVIYVCNKRPYLQKSTSKRNSSAGRYGQRTAMERPLQIVCKVNYNVICDWLGERWKGEPNEPSTACRCGLNRDSSHQCGVEVSRGCVCKRKLLATLTSNIEGQSLRSDAFPNCRSVVLAEIPTGHAVNEQLPRGNKGNIP